LIVTTNSFAAASASELSDCAWTEAVRKKLSQQEDYSNDLLMHQKPSRQTATVCWAPLGIQANVF
jgi:hypothetical protein